MEKKENKLWIIVWYDCDEEDDDGVITEDNPKDLPYRISCAYLDLTYSHWKYICFPNRAGKMSEWKRSEWMGTCYPLDFVFKDVNKHWKDLEGMKVEDLIDLTPYLAEDDAKELLKVAKHKVNELEKVLKWMEGDTTT